MPANAILKSWRPVQRGELRQLIPELKAALNYTFGDHHALVGTTRTAEEWVQGIRNGGGRRTLLPTCKDPLPGTKVLKSPPTNRSR